jgi:hypothetical protein
MSNTKDSYQRALYRKDPGGQEIFLIGNVPSPWLDRIEQVRRCAR